MLRQSLGAIIHALIDLCVPVGLAGPNVVWTRIRHCTLHITQTERNLKWLSGSTYCICRTDIWTKVLFWIFLLPYRLWLPYLTLTYQPLKGLFTNFVYSTFFSCFNKRNIFYKESNSIKQLWLEIIEKIGYSKSVRPSTVIYIIYIYNTDWLWAPFLSIISSQSCFIKMDLLWKVFFFETRKKSYSKLVNNPFKVSPCYICNIYL